MKTILRKVTALAVALCAAWSSHADITLNGIFANHMVLQRGIPVAVYGLADPGERVAVSFAGQSKSATANPDGTWQVKLSAMRASTNSATMTVAGKNQLTIQDIVVGDVWVCSGQSNMDFTPGAYGGPYDTNDFTVPLLRQFHVASRPSLHPESDVTGNNETAPKSDWIVCSPTSGVFFTAVGLYFGRKLQLETGVPIGLIKAPWNGTRIEPWLTPEGLASVPELPPAPEPPAKPAFDGGYPSTAFCLYNGMIHPLIRYGIKGALWYQGESNGGEGDTYYQKMRALIGGWRKAWNLGDFPFYYVQLAAFQRPNDNPAGGDGWAKIRMAQLESLKIPHTGMAVAIDLADVGKPDDIHPKDKKDVGERLALWALAKDYGRKDLVYSGPLYKEMKIEGDKIRLTFDSVGSGLAIATKKSSEPLVKDPQGKLQRFAIAGADKKWVWANAIIDGATVLVSSPEVPNPVAVRYAFSMCPEGCNLYNQEGLPGSPFRTDAW